VFAAFALIEKVIFVSKIACFLESPTFLPLANDFASMATLKRKFVSGSLQNQSKHWGSEA